MPVASTPVRFRFKKAWQVLCPTRINDGPSLGGARAVWQSGDLTAAEDPTVHMKLTATLAAAIALAGCATPTRQQQAAVDLQNDGIAKTCTPSAVDLAAATPATIAMTNDGWCGVFTAEKDGQPFNFGLVKTRPSHGRVYIQKIGAQTRVEYTPNAGYVGADSFAVALASRTQGTPDTALRVAVTVTQGDAPPATAASSAAPSRASTPNRAAAPTRAPARKRNP